MVCILVFLKEFVPSDVRLGRFKSDITRLLQPPKAPAPIIVTEVGILILVNEVQL